MPMKFVMMAKITIATGILTVMIPIVILSVTSAGITMVTDTSLKTAAEHK